MVRPLIEPNTGTYLWRTLPEAYRYAESKHFLYHTRQLVRPVRYAGELYYRVVKARRLTGPGVGEPCS